MSDFMIFPKEQFVCFENPADQLFLTVLPEQKYGVLLFMEDLLQASFTFFLRFCIFLQYLKYSLRMIQAFGIE